jgi:hypothetical protein
MEIDALLNSGLLSRLFGQFWSRVSGTGLYAFERLQIVLAVLFLAAILKEFFYLIMDVILTKLWIQT